MPLTQVKVGHRTFAVVPLTPELEESHNCYGLCEFAEQKIHVSPRISTPEQARVLIHEVLHAAWDMARLPDNARGEERIISSLDIALTTIIADSPGLLLAIHSALLQGAPVV